MITRSQARAGREGTQTHNKHMQKVGFREHIQYQRADMGRRGGNSSRGASSRRKPVQTAEVAPIRLFSTTEGVNTEDEPLNRVSIGVLHNFESRRLDHTELIIEVLSREILWMSYLSSFLGLRYWLGLEKF